MATKDYLSVKKKIKIKTEDGKIYYIGKPNDPNDFGNRTLYDGSRVVIFSLCRVLGLKEGELLKVVAGGRPWSFWGSPSEIMSITIDN